MRVDRWLWYARFFKTRSLAASAVKSGRVTVNGKGVKPAREVTAGERISISRSGSLLEVDVISIPRRRGPYEEASLSYEETAKSIAARQSARLAADKRTRIKRPDARGRRRLRRLKRVEPT